MAENIGRNRNFNEAADVKNGIQLNSSSSTKIADANPNRKYFHVNSNFSDKASWIKLQAASVDNTKKGIFLNEKEKGVTHWDMPPDNIYTGEISNSLCDGVLK